MKGFSYQTWIHHLTGGVYMMNKPAYQMYHMFFKSCNEVRCATSNLEVLLHFLAIVASTFTTFKPASSSKAAAAAAYQLVRSILHQSRKHEKFPPTTFSTAIQLRISIINIKLGSNRNGQLANLCQNTSCPANLTLEHYSRATLTSSIF